MKASDEYEVARPYQALWTEARIKNYCRILPVYGTDELQVPPHRFADVLRPGAVIEVVFTLKHWPFFGTDRKPSSDTFGAHLDMITILKDAPVPLLSPYRVRSRRPLHVSQMPGTLSRGELKRAADAFIPGPISQPSFTSRAGPSKSKAPSQPPASAANSEGSASSSTLSSTEDGGNDTCGGDNEGDNAEQGEYYVCFCIIVVSYSFISHNIY